MTTPRTSTLIAGGALALLLAGCAGPVEVHRTYGYGDAPYGYGYAPYGASPEDSGGPFLPLDSVPEGDHLTTGDRHDRTAQAPDETRMGDHHDDGTRHLLPWLHQGDGGDAG